MLPSKMIAMQDCNATATTNKQNKTKQKQNKTKTNKQLPTTAPFSG